MSHTLYLLCTFYLYMLCICVSVRCHKYTIFDICVYIYYNINKI